MKKGDVVTIFADPITCKRREGEAVLISKLDDSHDLERWDVHFLGDEVGYNYGRQIKKTKP